MDIIDKCRIFAIIHNRLLNKEERLLMANTDESRLFANTLQTIIADFNTNTGNDFRLYSESFDSVYSEVLYSSMYVKDIDDKFSICITIALNKYSSIEYITISCYAAERVITRGYLPFYGDMQDYKVINNNIETNKIYDIITNIYNYVISGYKEYYEREVAK